MPKAYAAIYPKIVDDLYGATIVFPEGDVPSKATLSFRGEAGLPLALKAVLDTINPPHLDYRYTPVITIYTNELEYFLDHPNK